MNRKRLASAAAATVLLLPLGGCISVKTPEKPIEINLNVTIKQEVLVRLQRDVELPPLAVIYLNRLSDLLFTLARLANRRAGTGEVTW